MTDVSNRTDRLLQRKIDAGRPAFTLFELLVTMFIIAVVVSGVVVANRTDAGLALVLIIPFTLSLLGMPATVVGVRLLCNREYHAAGLHGPRDGTTCLVLGSLMLAAAIGWFWLIYETAFLA